MISLLTHLQVRGQMTAAELAQHLEVSQRTVQRDVEALVASGVPIRSVRGPAGGYQLPGGYRTRLTGVAADEAPALAFLGLAGPAGELGLDGPLRAARGKVWAALTDQARDRAERTAQRFHLDPARWYGTSEPTPLLTALAEAVWRDQRVRVQTLREGTVTERVLDPLGLVLAAGDWYLLAHRDRALHTYRVARLVHVELLDDPARRPAGFVLAQAWADARRELETRHELLEVTVRVANSALPRLRRLVAGAGQDRIHLTNPSPQVEITVPFESASWARTALLGLGAGVEVLAPADLREQIGAQARATAAHYTDPPSREQAHTTPGNVCEPGPRRVGSADR